ncbi:MAG: hypothetical protein ACRC10_01475 [Thermoguttaceae bacterium]
MSRIFNFFILSVDWGHRRLQVLGYNEASPFSVVDLLTLFPLSKLMNHLLLSVSLFWGRTF